MNNTIIKKVTEKTIKDNEGKSQNQVEITFKTSIQGLPVSETITLTGDGSLKVLMPV